METFGNTSLPKSLEDAKSALEKLENATSAEVLKEQAEAAAKIEIDTYNEIMTLKKELMVQASNFEQKLKSDDKKRQLEFLAEIADEDLKLKQESYDKWKKESAKHAKAKIAEEEKRTKRKLTDEEKQKIISEFKYTDEVRKKYEAKAEKERGVARRAALEQEFKEANAMLLKSGSTITERFSAIKTMATNTETGKFSITKLSDSLVKSVASLSQQLDHRIDEIGKNKSLIDTRLQGSLINDQAGSSYWDKMSKEIVSLAGASPYFKQSELVNNINTMVKSGISFNVTQRAFLQTISDKIADTFDANNGTLRRLIRIQQQDTTAGRLGMESSINAFLNTMYETTEYMGGVMDSVKSSLEESMALMGGKEATEFEYQVQKWMGSLYSVGMSQNAVSGIASALGKLASGDINGLFGSGTGNLMVMAANEAGLPIAEMLSKGLDDSQTNSLLDAMVSYLANIYNDTQGNLVVQQQMAGVYNVMASDLKAAASLANSQNTRNSINKSNLSYEGALQQLMNMAGSIASRTSMGEMSSNLWENIQESMAAGVANNPALYAMLKSANLLDAVAGGGNLPSVMAAGFGVDLNTTISDLMKFGAVGGGIMSSMGRLIAGFGNSMSVSTALSSLGIGSNSGVTTLSRGSIDANSSLLSLMNSSGSNNTSSTSRGSGVSESGMSTMVGNASGTDVKNRTMQEANDTVDSKQAEVREKDENSVDIKVVNSNIVDIYSLLRDVVDGTASLSVRNVMTLDQSRGWT